MTMLLAGRVPGFLPPLIADAIAQCELDIGLFPSLPFKRASTTCVLARSTIPETMGQQAAEKERRAHQGKPFAQRVQMLMHFFSIAFTIREAIGHTGKSIWTAMFEHVETAFEHVSRKDATASAHPVSFPQL